MASRVPCGAMRDAHVAYQTLAGDPAARRPIGDRAGLRRVRARRAIERVGRVDAVRRALRGPRHEPESGGAAVVVVPAVGSPLDAGQRVSVRRPAVHGHRLQSSRAQPVHCDASPMDRPGHWHLRVLAAYTSPRRMGTPIQVADPHGPPLRDVGWRIAGAECDSSRRRSAISVSSGERPDPTSRPGIRRRWTAPP